MSDTLSLADRTLNRLRTYAKGNGLPPESIQILKSSEDIYTLEGQLTLTPSFEKQVTSRAGKAIEGKGITIYQSVSALEEAATHQQEAFEKSGAWLEAAHQEIEKDPGHGWGLDEAEISWPDQISTLAATENCPACEGKGQHTCVHCHGTRTIPCIYCQGTGQELCPQCQGRGDDPAHPGQPCPICNGKKFLICRYCAGQGKTPCAQCQGKGGTACPQCNGTGFLTQEIKLKRGAKLRFALGHTTEYPSGLLRLITRIGLPNLPKGHVNVRLQRPPKNQQQSEQEQNIIRLTAQALYGEMTMRIGKREQVVYAFGKKGYLSNIPPFLDQYLLPARKKLVEAAKGQRPHDHALAARALRDALGLVLNGRNTTNALRCLYPIGLSSDVAQEIMQNMGLLLRNITQKFRALTGAGLIFGSAILFAAFYFSPLPAYLRAQQSPKTLLILEALVPALVLGIDWYVLLHATRWALKQKFPKATIAPNQNIGKIGLTTLGVIVIVYLLIWKVCTP